MIQRRRDGSFESIYDNIEENIETGRPKKGKLIPSVAEIGGKKRNKKRPYWCGVINNMLNNCFKYPHRKDKEDEE